MRDSKRDAYNAEFVARYLERHPGEDSTYKGMIAARPAPAMALAMGGNQRVVPPVVLVNETIVRRERPVLFVKDDWIDRVNVTAFGAEAGQLVNALDAQRAVFQPLIPLIGRIDVVDFPDQLDYLGTAWFVDTDIVVTNRHVASLIARWDGRRYGFHRGIGGKDIGVSLGTQHEFDDPAQDKARTFEVTEVLYIEPELGPHDIAFLRVNRKSDGTQPDRIPIAPVDAANNTPVFVVGYPARAARDVIEDQNLMQELYRGHYDVKRAAPGYTMLTREDTGRHDCTTLGGNSGSVVFNLKTGQAIGLHFAGLYRQTNYAVLASTLNEYISKKRWTRPPDIETGRPLVASPKTPQLPAQPVAGGSVTVTIPLTITVSLGALGGAQTLTNVGVAAAQPSLAAADEAVKAFWDRRPEGVIAARVGFLDHDGRIGDTPCIVASVLGNRLEATEAAAPDTFQGLAVRYLPATVAEQIDNMPVVESVDAISYDDNARTGEAFSFDPVEEEMTVLAHVGPEYSWDVLSRFLASANQTLVSAMYEFHAPQIKDALKARLDAGASLKLVMDNATFSPFKADADEFNRVDTFDDWKTAYKDRFDRIVVPEGRTGLISDAYHIKVTVREDDTFWLSSGNWKARTSQPVITQDQRDNAANKDLPGNREWHVVVANKTLAERFRSHILQDFQRSTDLHGGPLPIKKKKTEAPEIFIDVPVEEGIVLERRAPSRILEPREFAGTISAKPLLTPDGKGSVYSDAVLAFIRSAKQSLLFQIPYITLPSNPRTSRGYIDDLIAALVEKMTSLRDARVILSGGSAYSDPTHVAWYMKSKGVDINARLHRMDKHHTKGMVIDGKRVLIGSHNWSQPGVTLNRDASMIFYDENIAGYFTEAFKIDWDRSNPITPKEHKKTEGIVTETVAGAPRRPGYRRVSLSELLKQDD